MNSPPPDRWTKAEGILDRALDRPPQQRADFIQHACAGDSELRRMVDEWLAACEQPTLFPDSPAAVYGAELIPAGSGSDPAASDVTLKRIGPYRVVRELGRGGMGAVFLAERDDGQFDQRVALKLMRRELGGDAQLRRRFLEERQILAHLQHPHIAALLDGGVTTEGQPFFVMQYIEGLPIDRFCDERRLSIDERLAVFMDVCRAVDYAHRQQVVHRDLKPGNILVTEDGQAKLLDFGIAKLIETDADDSSRALTRTGERLLTPDYASPEQIRGEGVTTASDVYALGVLLHEMLTGRWPYGRGRRTPHEVERAVLETDPTLPSAAITQPASAGEGRHAATAEKISEGRQTTPDRLRRRLRGDLDAIVLTALRKNPQQRYPTAGALAEDLRRHLRGLPVGARRRAAGYRLLSVARRHRVALTAGGAGLLTGASMLLFGLLGFPWGRAPIAATAEVPVLAIGRIIDYRGGGPGDLIAPLTDMLATNLARAGGLSVVSSARMYELVQQGSGLADVSEDSYARAARQAGATELLEGTIYTNAAGGLRLDLRRVDLRSGSISGAQTATGADLFALADSATTRLVAEFGLTPPPGSIADVTTRSLAAYRLYTEGMQLLFARDSAAAEASFEAALREDTTFAMAAFYSAQVSAFFWRSASATAAARQLSEERTRRALRLADRASDGERLMIRAWYALFHFAPNMRAVAETLAVRYPQEIYGHLALGQSLGLEGDFLAAIPHLRQVLEMDSASLRIADENCLACDALHGITESYAILDSLEAAERMARSWLELQPYSSTAFNRLADVLDGQGQYAETSRLLGSEIPVTSRSATAIPLVKHWIRAGDLATADNMLLRWMENGDGSDLSTLLYFHALTLRNQGRLTAALQTARRMREVAGEAPIGAAAPPSALVEAQMLFELGRFREAEALFDSIGRWPAEGQPASVQATQRVLALTMAAASRYARGDTTRLAAAADSLEKDGLRARMFRPRDQYLYVRGLLLAARGQGAAAADLFQRALEGATSDFGRVNRELALLLLAAGRPMDAVAALNPIARGWFLETTNLHMGLTETHELLAEAWEAAGVPDSAAVHWARVARDWEHADAVLQPRRARALERAGPSRSD